MVGLVEGLSATYERWLRGEKGFAGRYETRHGAPELQVVEGGIGQSGPGHVERHIGLTYREPDIYTVVFA